MNISSLPTISKCNIIRDAEESCFLSIFTGRVGNGGKGRTYKREIFEIMRE